MHFQKVVPDLLLKLSGQSGVFHGRVDQIDFILIIGRLGVRQEDENRNLTCGPGHEDEPTNIHNDHVEQVKGLRWLHLVAADDQDGVVNADGPSVTPLA